MRCHLEDALLPGVTRAAIAGKLRQRFGAAGDSLHGGRRLTGWYLQQVWVRFEGVGYRPGHDNAGRRPWRGYRSAGLRQ